MKRLVGKSGLDLTHLNAVLVGGTNGKGSVCALVERALREEGYRTGLYTSPHLLDVKERLQISGKKISAGKFRALEEWVKPFVLAEKASYFEAITLMALKYFIDEKAEWAVAEVGMGGRLDATNVLVPKVAAITNISLEHTENLGNTIPEIAREKAGIIKRGAWAVVTGAKGTALEEIRKKAGKEGVKTIVVETGKNKTKTGLKGEFQKENAGVAVCILNALRENGVKISAKAQQAGLKKAEWPGRFQKIGNFLVDGAHNPAGIKALLESLPEKRMNLVFGVLADKDYKEMTRILAGRKWLNVWLVEPKTDRALELKKLEKAFKTKNVSFEECGSVKEALAKAGKVETLVCGSFFVAAEALKALGWKQ